MDTVNKEWNIKVDFITFYKFSVTEIDMRRQMTEEEKELSKIYEPYIDEKTRTLKDDAPIEAKEALKKAKEIAFEIRRADALGLPCRYKY